MNHAESQRFFVFPSCTFVPLVVAAFDFPSVVPGKSRLAALSYK